MKATLFEAEVWWHEEDDGYIAKCERLPGLSAYGKTVEAATEELRKVFELAATNRPVTIVHNYHNSISIEELGKALTTQISQHMQRGR